MRRRQQEPEDDDARFKQAFERGGVVKVGGVTFRTAEELKAGLGEETPQGTRTAPQPATTRQPTPSQPEPRGRKPGE